MKRLISTLCLLLLLFGAYIMSRTPDIGSNLPLFYAGFALASLGYLGILWRGLPAGGRAWFLFFIIALIGPRWFALNLYTSDDIPRYIWEGKILLNGYNPYAVPPDDPRLEPYRDEIYPKINHPDMPAIYPPLSQYMFAALSLATERVEGYRLFLLLIEMLSIIMMFRWVLQLGLPRDRVLIYALNPLVVLGIAGHGHLDPLQILLLVLGLDLYGRRREGAGMILITLAGLVKFLGFLALPFLINRKTVKYLPLCLGIVLFAYLPFFFMEGSFSFGNLGHYLNKFEYYSLTFAALRTVLGPAGAQGVTGLVLAAVMMSLWLTRTRPEYAVPPFLLLLTLMSTTVHYWYLIPLLALAVVWKSRPLIALSLLFWPYFEVLERFVIDGSWDAAWWRPAATYIPFLILWWLDKTGRWPVFHRRELSTGVVVPVLNDAGPLRRLLDSLEKAAVPKHQVVVADGGSQDDSRVVAEEWGARVVRCPRSGRGSQIATGIRQLDTDLVIVLHADTLASPNLVSAVRRTADSCPDASGGACRLRYSGGTTGLKLLALPANAKTMLFGLSFGDAGQWFHRRAVEMPEIPLMVFVELAIRINDCGPAAWAPTTLTVSTRRYRSRGPVGVAGSVFPRLLRYLMVRRWTDVVPDTGGLYESYYDRRC